MIILYLTCADTSEAEKIADLLLERKLITCARLSPVSSKYLWKGRKESANEVLLMMETINSKFDAIEELVEAHHSYDTPALVAVESTKTSRSTLNWIDEELA